MNDDLLFCLLIIIHSFIHGGEGGGEGEGDKTKGTGRIFGKLLNRNDSNEIDRPYS